MNPELFLYTEIGEMGISAEDFISQLKAYNGQRVTLRINSPGGSVFEGAAIYNAVKRHAGGVDVFIDGLAASMASVIACGGATITMAQNALFMIHNPWSGAVGDAEELRREADLLDKVKETIIESYTNRSFLSREDIAALMDEETWMNAEQALDLGFIDAIAEPAKAAARFDLSRFKNAADVDRFENTMSQEEKINETVAETEAQETEQQIEVVAEETATEIQPEARPVAEETAAAPAEVAEPVAESPALSEATVTIDSSKFDEIANRVTAERAELEQLRNEAASLRAEVQSLRAGEIALKAELSKASDLLALLEKAKGLAPAQTVPVIAPSNEGPSDILAQFESMSGAEASAFYAKHKAEIRKAIAARR